MIPIVLIGCPNLNEFDYSYKYENDIYDERVITVSFVSPEGRHLNVIINEMKLVIRKNGVDDELTQWDNEWDKGINTSTHYHYPDGFREEPLEGYIEIIYQVTTNSPIQLYQLSRDLKDLDIEMVTLIDKFSEDTLYEDNFIRRIDYSFNLVLDEESDEKYNPVE